MASTAAALSAVEGSEVAVAAARIARALAWVASGEESELDLTSVEPPIA
jgi:hypothetical protein